MWEVGRLLFWACWTTPCAVSTSHEPQATSRRLNPHPGPPPRGGSIVFSATKSWINGAAWAPDPVRGMPRLAGAKRPWPGTRLHLSTDLIPIPRTRRQRQARSRVRAAGNAEDTVPAKLMGNYNPRATIHMPPLSIPRTRLALPAEIRGPCREQRRGLGCR